jgi:uncharacterized protein YjbI with pentapeptide repeats
VTSLLVVVALAIKAFNGNAATESTRPSSESEAPTVVAQQLKLTNTTLLGLILPGGDLRYADMSDVTLGAADLSNSRFTDSRLIRVDLRSSNLRDAEVTNSDLTGSDLRGACARRAVLRGAALLGTQFDGADLRGADLSGAVIDRSTSFTNVTYDDDTIWPAGAQHDRSRPTTACQYGD